ncbi:fasciclin domain-containing protein [Anabaena cylindrica FACHB-243]|uniref:Beta-Ig-H3/fasciclin n=1 Tax=Anabaena cylindrica (strain ATCC 27899 / PCC 7122) TaxID=272123 RepID=K9ZBJ2_ANACC|nr:MULTISPECIES: fasciclin domain-containing protein [Anabaena]AFZ55715.1 beta-Ig-H3/fasciclin [Anabaena cylindrica PCC 7122]MBD2420281.1 fasciclin domain-containing protein [Anabaena cylindrica FACHB-243]MBY5282105.1 fasciclin domain-containing protein [Anabaena sp. CCAP 1446/1C]MBY5309598.1 fasciclin domain-containing protein [Anabaena sp. CCAP 1446/1C]MCM2406064.1 fasciclin domain-containing protein [Anabaena sp. CCAP 1446/1C]
MKANYSKLVTNLACILGVTGFSLLVTLPSRANEILNPHQSIQANSQSIPANLALKTENGNTKSKTQIAQSQGSGVLNPRPNIFNEPPYNGRTVPSETPPVRPTQPRIETPTTSDTKPQPTSQPTETTETKNVIEVAESAGSFTMLIKALEAAGLTEVLKGAGPFTVFAPTDAAFAKLPQDAVQDLLKPENKEVLVKVLTYHVVPGKVLSSDLKSGQVTSVQGDPINVKIDPAKGVFVNDAQVTKADIPASNGVIHVIDNLILPPSL